MLENAERVGDLPFWLPPDVLSAGVEPLCEFQEDRGVSFCELALSVFEAIVSHPHFPIVDFLAKRPNLVSKLRLSGVELV